MYKKFIVLSIVLLIVTVVLRVNYHYLSDDGIQYTDLGINFLKSGVFDSRYGVVPGWSQSPFFPVLIGIFYFLFPLHWAGTLVGLFAVLATGLIVYRCTASMFDEKTAFFSIVLFYVNPIIIRQILIVSTEPLYTFVHVLLFILCIKIVSTEDKLKISDMMLTSVLIIILAMTRVEGILYVIWVPIIVLVRKKVKAAGIIFIMTVLLLIPYTLFVHAYSGNYTFLPKLKVNARNAIVLQQKEALERIKTADQAYMEELRWYLLDEQDSKIFTLNLLDREYYNSLLDKKVSSESSAETGSIVNIIFSNFFGVFKVAFRSYAFPLSFLILILIGSVESIRRQSRKLFFAIFWLLPATYFMVSHVEDRFFFVFLPYLSVISAYGIINLFNRFRYKTSLLYLSMGLYVVNASYYYNILQTKLEKNEKLYQLSSFLSDSIPDEEEVCIKYYMPTFYSGHRYLRMPIANPVPFFNYLSKNNCEYVVLGREIDNLRKDFKPIYDENIPTHFSFIKEVEYNNETFKLFKVLK